jgi:hypothetical protein
LFRSTGKRTQAINQVSRSTKQAATAMEIFNKSSQDLTKSVQVALGPLSGVAARITAMTALFNRNNLAAAALSVRSPALLWLQRNLPPLQWKPKPLCCVWKRL